MLPVHYLLAAKYYDGSMAHGALIGADAVSAFPHLPVLSFFKSEADPSHAFAHCSQICPYLTSFTLYESARGTNVTPTKPTLRSSRGELVMSSPEHGTWVSQRLVGRRSISRSFISDLWRAVEGRHRGSMNRRYIRSFHFSFRAQVFRMSILKS